MVIPFEGIIRPFETRDVTPRRVDASGMDRDSEIVALEFGRGGAGRPMNGSASVTITVYMDTRLKEVAS